MDKQTIISILEQNLGPLTPSEAACVEAIFDARRFEPQNEGETLRGEFLATICRDGQLSEAVPNHGIDIMNVKITGKMDARFCKIAFPLRLKKCVFERMIILKRAKLEHIDITESTFAGINASSSTIDGSLNLSGTRLIANNIKLVRAKIVGSLTINHCNYTTPHVYAIKAYGADIAGLITIKNSIINGGIKLTAAKIGSSINIIESKILGNDQAPSIKAERLCVNDNILFKNSSITGRCKFTNSIIHNNVNISTTSIIERHSKYYAIMLLGCRVNNTISLNGNLNIQGNINLEYARAENSIRFLPKHCETTTKIHLTGARTLTFHTNQFAWENDLFGSITSFAYDTLTSSDPEESTYQSMLKALIRQPRFIPQPFEQLAYVLKNNGYHDEATEVLIAKSRKRTQSMKHTPERWWNTFLGWTLGYGYKPLRPFAISCIFIMLGTVIFHFAFEHDAISPLSSKTYINNPTQNPNPTREKPSCNLPEFASLTYSIDAFIPSADLYQSDFWTPNSSTTWGTIARCYLWLHILAGWIFTSLLLLGLTGLMKK